VSLRRVTIAFAEFCFSIFLLCGKETDWQTCFPDFVPTSHHPALVAKRRRSSESTTSSAAAGNATIGDGKLHQATSTTRYLWRPPIPALETDCKGESVRCCCRRGRRKFARFRFSTSTLNVFLRSRRTEHGLRLADNAIRCRLPSELVRVESLRPAPFSRWVFFELWQFRCALALRLNLPVRCCFSAAKSQLMRLPALYPWQHRALRSCDDEKSYRNGESAVLEVILKYHLYSFYQARLACACVAESRYVLFRCRLAKKRVSSSASSHQHDEFLPFLSFVQSW